MEKQEVVDCVRVCARVCECEIETEREREREKGEMMMIRDHIDENDAPYNYNILLNVKCRVGKKIGVLMREGLKSRAVTG